jgi:hypothetical protein
MQNNSKIQSNSVNWFTMKITWFNRHILPFTQL